MVRILLLSSVILLAGCFPNKRPQEVQIQTVNVPILYCPAPPQVERPALPIHEMTPEQRHNAGEVVKHYKATVKTLQGYALELERIIEQYGENSQQYEELKQELLEKLKQDGVITETQ